MFLKYLPSLQYVMLKKHIWKTLCHGTRLECRQCQTEDGNKHLELFLCPLVYKYFVKRNRFFFKRRRNIHLDPWPKQHPLCCECLFRTFCDGTCAPYVHLVLMLPVKLEVQRVQLWCFCRLEHHILLQIFWTLKAVLHSGLIRYLESRMRRRKHNPQTNASTESN